MPLSEPEKVPREALNFPPPLALQVAVKIPDLQLALIVPVHALLLDEAYVPDALQVIAPNVPLPEQLPVSVPLVVVPDDVPEQVTFPIPLVHLALQAPLTLPLAVHENDVVAALALPAPTAVIAQTATTSRNRLLTFFMYSPLVGDFSVRRPDGRSAVIDRTGWTRANLPDTNG